MKVEIGKWYKIKEKEITGTQIFDVKVLGNVKWFFGRKYFCQWGNDKFGAQYGYKRESNFLHEIKQ